MVLKFPFSGSRLPHIKPLLLCLLIIGSTPNVSGAGDFPNVCKGAREYSNEGWRDKIIAGDRALIKQFPWIATIAAAKPERSADAHLCGAVILGPRWLLTAAHCVWDCRDVEKEIVAYAGGDFYGTPPAGSATELEGPLSIAHVYVNEGFKGENVDRIGVIPRNDIALVELAVPLSFGERIASVKTADQSQLSEMISNRTFAKVAGFGRKSAFGNPMRPMQQMDARIYDNKLCNLATAMNGALIEQEMICVGDADSRDRACKGDSGGGLVGSISGSNTVFGLVSWKRDCDSGQGLGAYTNVSNYGTWIAQVLNNSGN